MDDVAPYRLPVPSGAPVRALWSPAQPPSDRAQDPNQTKDRREKENGNA